MRQNQASAKYFLAFQITIWYCFISSKRTNKALFVKQKSILRTIQL